jgi:hypothetical protein
VDTLKRKLPDLALLLLALAVGTSAVLALTNSPAPPTAQQPTAGTTEVSPTPTPTPSPTAAVAGDFTGPILVVGADLTRLAEDLGRATGAQVLSADAGVSTVIADGALSQVTDIPTVVVLQVLPGTQTAQRTTDAVAQVRAVWPTAAIAVVGPFDGESAKSTTAVETAALDANVVFLDPVARGWRTEASAIVGDDELSGVASHLAQDLQAP